MSEARSHVDKGSVVVDFAIPSVVTTILSSLGDALFFSDSVTFLSSSLAASSMEGRAFSSVVGESKSAFVFSVKD